jgi:hypothetical protein
VTQAGADTKILVASRVGRSIRTQEHASRGDPRQSPIDGMTPALTGSMGAGLAIAGSQAAADLPV